MISFPIRNPLSYEDFIVYKKYFASKAFKEELSDLKSRLPDPIAERRLAILKAALNQIKSTKISKEAEVVTSETPPESKVLEEKELFLDLSRKKLVSKTSEKTKKSKKSNKSNNLASGDSRVSKMNWKSIFSEAVHGSISPPSRDPFIYALKLPTKDGFRSITHNPLVGEYIHNIDFDEDYVGNEAVVPILNDIVPMQIGKNLSEIESEDTVLIQGPTKTVPFLWHNLDYIDQKLVTIRYDNRSFNIEPSLFIPDEEERDFWKEELPLDETTIHYLEDCKTIEDVLQVFQRLFREGFFYVCHDDLGNFLIQNSEYLPLIIQNLKIGHCSVLAWTACIFLRQIGITAVVVSQLSTNVFGTSFMRDYTHAQVLILNKNGKYIFFDPTKYTLFPNHLSPERLSSTIVAELEVQFTKAESTNDKKAVLLYFYEKYINIRDKSTLPGILNDVTDSIIRIEDYCELVYSSDEFSEYSSDYLINILHFGRSDLINGKRNSKLKFKKMFNFLKETCPFRLYAEPKNELDFHDRYSFSSFYSPLVRLVAPLHTTRLTPNGVNVIGFPGIFDKETYGISNSNIRNTGSTISIALREIQEAGNESLDLFDILSYPRNFLNFGPIPIPVKEGSNAHYFPYIKNVFLLFDRGRLEKVRVSLEYLKQIVKCIVNGEEEPSLKVDEETRILGIKQFIALSNVLTSFFEHPEFWEFDSDRRNYLKLIGIDKSFITNLLKKSADYFTNKVRRRVVDSIDKITRPRVVSYKLYSEIFKIEEGAISHNQKIISTILKPIKEAKYISKEGRTIGPYSEGEGSKNIDWKISERTGQLVSHKQEIMKSTNRILYVFLHFSEHPAAPYFNILSQLFANLLKFANIGWDVYVASINTDVWAKIKKTDNPFKITESLIDASIKTIYENLGVLTNEKSTMSEGDALSKEEKALLKKIETLNINLEAMKSLLTPTGFPSNLLFLTDSPWQKNIIKAKYGHLTKFHGYTLWDLGFKMDEVRLDWLSK